jgi:hypothetical protein
VLAALVLLGVIVAFGTRERQAETAARREMG